MATLRFSPAAFVLGLALVPAACGGSETPNGTKQADPVSLPAAEDAAAWRSWLSASMQSAWQGDFVSTYDEEAAQEGSFVLLGQAFFYVQTRTALRQHSPEGQAAAQSIQVEVACDGEELLILLPAVLGAGPTVASIAADRLSALEEVDPLGRAGLFRLDALSPWHLVRRSLDYGRPLSSAASEEHQQLQLEVPAGTLARFPKEEMVQATLFLHKESAVLDRLELVSSTHRLTVAFSKLEQIQDLQAAGDATKLEVPKGTTPLNLGPIVDAELQESTSTNLDQLGY